MTTEENLVRLFEDPGVSADLRADLNVARSFEMPFDVGAGLARFQAHLDVSPSGVSHPPPSGVTHAPPLAANGGAAALQLTGGKVLAVLALGAGLGWGALHFAGGAGSPRVEAPARNAAPMAPAERPALQQPASERAPKAAAPERDVPAVAPLAPHAQSLRAPRAAALRPSAGAPLSSSPQPPAEVASANALPVPAPAERVPAPAAPSADAQDRLRQEVSQLAQVRRVVKSDPAAALALAEQGHREFRDGALYQEREALALQALSQLGRAAAVESRGTAFLAQFPQSSFAPEVRRMLAK